VSRKKLAEEAIRSIHTKSSLKAAKTDQEADFVVERKKLTQETDTYKREIAHLRHLCAKNKIDTSTRKQREAQERELRAPKEKSAKKSTAASTDQPAADDAATGADA
jgi:hypothetical protein